MNILVLLLISSHLETCVLNSNVHLGKEILVFVCSDLLIDSRGEYCGISGERLLSWSRCWLAYIQCLKCVLLQGGEVKDEL